MTHTNNQIHTRSSISSPNIKFAKVAYRCPEPNQPRVEPSLWDANGLGVTALRNPPLNPVTGAFNLRISDGRDNQFTRALQKSGRIYTCDKFPLASWAEYGVGTVGKNNPEGDGKNPTTLINNELIDFVTGGAETTFCGFKEQNCGAKCISNCDAKGMYGIDSENGKTACGLRLWLECIQ